MTIAFVPAAHISADLAAGGTTPSFDSSTCNALVAVVGYFSGQPVLSDSKGNTWTLIASYPANITQGFVELWYVSSTGTFGVGHAVTSGTNRCAIAIGGFSGTLASTPYDSPNQNGAGVLNSATVQPGSVTPSAANSLLVTGLYFESGTLTSVGSGFTVIDTQLPGNSAVSLAYKIQTAAAAENPLWTVSGSNTRIGAEIASFLAAAGGGPAVEIDHLLLAGVT